jgi:hypothetical protein
MEDKSLEMAETMKSILFWQKVIVALFVVGLVLLGSMAGTLPFSGGDGYTSRTECIVREEAKGVHVGSAQNYCRTLGLPD